MDHESDCPKCNAGTTPMGQLGSRLHFRCAHCGWMWSEAAPVDVELETEVDEFLDRDDADHEDRYADHDRPEYERELPDDYEPSPYDGTYSED